MDHTKWPKIDDNSITGIEVAVKVMFFSFYVRYGEIRCNAPVRDLTESNRGEAKGENDEQLFHGLSNG
ncbi:MAG: hypothetical protein CL845_05390 [Crocinitomicaceae bacterium]|nr:hypothetical protein [Crocinitomicaceae bacterium]